MEQTAISVAFSPAPTHHPRLEEVVGLPSPRYISHWALISQDLAASELFYQTLTGAKLICRPQPVSAALSFDHEHHRFFIGSRPGFLAMTGRAELAKAPAARACERIGPGGGAIRYRSPKALVNALERMRAIGSEPAQIVDRGGSVSVIYRDPDNLIVETFAAVEGGSAARETTIDAAEFVRRFA